MQSNNWIEIAGLPGVGKTTLISQNLSSLAQHDKIINSRQPTLLNRITTRFLLHGWLEHRCHNKDLARALAYRLSFRWFLYAKTRTFFYDAGILQLLLEFMIEGEPAITQEFIGLLPQCRLPTTLIFIDDDLNAIIAREINRSPRRFPEFSPEALSQRYQNALSAFKNQIFPMIPNVHIVSVQQPEQFMTAINHEKSS